MKLITNLSIRKKLAFTNSIAAILIIAVGATGFYFINQSAQTLDDMYENKLLGISYIAEAETLTAKSNSALFEMLSSNDMSRSQSLKNDIRKNQEDLDKVLEKIRKIDLDPTEMDLLNAIEEQVGKTNTLSTKVIQLALNNKNTEAYGIFQQEQSGINTQLTDNLKALSEHSKETAEKSQSLNVANLKTATTIILGLILFALIFGFMVSRFIGKIVSRPLVAMTKYMQLVAEGDLSEESLSIITATKLHKDEIGTLATNVMIMREKLHSLISSVSDSTSNIAASAEELTANSEQTSAGIDDIAQSVMVIAGSTDQQLASVTETSNALSDISARIQETAANTYEAAEVAIKTKEATVNGEKAVAATRTQMYNIEKTVNGLETMVRILQTRSQEIEGFVGAIVNISDQTNLLALNAAIEAARAGEHGRGFAVVADEVRKLAEESQNSAHNITALITQIQDDTNQAVNAMVEGSEQVKYGLTVVDNAGESFNTIAQYVEEITEQVGNISRATQEMADGSQRAVDVMHALSSISQEVTDQSQNISASVEEQSASMQEVAHSSENLAVISEGLQTQIHQFKL